MLPAWMVDEKRGVPEVAGARRRKGRIGQRALSGFYDVMKRELAVGVSSAKGGFLQRIDSRVKLIATALLLVTVSVLTNALALALCLLAFVVAGIASRVNGRALLGLLVPPVILAVALVLPASLNLVTPGKPLVQLVYLGEGASVFGWDLPRAIAITESGAIVAARFVFRSLACVSLVSVLVMTTGWSAIVSGLRDLGLPRIFSLTFLMMYRYLFVLIRYAEETGLAKESRTVSKERVVDSNKMSAARMGHLFGTARRLGDQVYLAMAARGFSGVARALDRRPLRTSDYLAIAVTVVICGALALADRSLIGGGL